MSDTAGKTKDRVTEVAAAGRWPWHPVQTVVIAALVFIASQLLAFALVISAAGLYSKLAGWSSERLTDWLNDATLAKFLLIVVAEVFVVLGVRWILKRRGIAFRAIGFGRPSWRDVWLPIVAFGFYFSFFLMLVAVLQQLLPGLDVNQKQDIGFDSGAGGASLVMIFLALVVCAPIAEEVLFRGFLFTSLRQRSTFWLATLGTSVLFGAAHLAGGEQGASLLWIAGIDTMLLSFALCYLRETTGKLWAPILLHSIKNGLAFTLLFVIQT